MKLRNLKRNQAGFAGSVGVVISVLVTIVVGLLVYYKVIGSLGGGGSTAQVAALTAVNNTANV